MWKAQNAFTSLSGLYPNTNTHMMKDKLFTHELVCLPQPRSPREAHRMMKRLESELGMKMGLD